MKVLFLTGSLNQGGAEFQTLALADLFQRKGYEVKVFALTDYDALYHYVESYKLDYEHLDNKDSKIKRIFKTVKFINRYQPDVVISFTRVVSKVALISKLLSWKNFKLLISERTSLTLPKKDKFYFFIARYADVITTNSISKLDYIKERFPKLKSSTHFFPNILNLKNYESKRSLAGDDVIKFCYVGRISPEKNVENLILGFCQLKDQQKKWKLNIYGESRSPKYLEKTQLTIRENNLEENVELHGVTKDVKSVYNNHNYLCLLSFYEGFSNVLSEALASGLPIIASDIKENAFLVQRDINGFLTSPDNLTDIASVIKKALHLDKQAWTKISLNNQDRAKEIFNEDVLFEKYISLFSN